MNFKDANESEPDYFEDLTGEIPLKYAEPGEEIGQRIQRLREGKSLSLQDLSDLTGFDALLLDRIENQQVQPQLGTLIKLSRALDAAIGRLIAGDGSRMYTIARKTERGPVQRSTSREGTQQVYSYMSLAPEVRGRHMEALIVHLETVPNPQMSAHEGEEFIYVLDGQIRITIGGNRHCLYPGDSIYFLSTTAHQLVAENNKATILAVIYHR